MSTLQIFLERWPVLLFYQYQGVQATQWQHIRSQLGEHMTCRVVKNSALVAGLGDTPLFRGSCCVVGLQSLHQVPQALDTMGAHSTLLYALGGYVQGQFWTSAELERYARLPNSQELWRQLLTTMSPQLHTHLVWTNHHMTQTLQESAQTLLHTMAHHSAE